MANPTKVFVGSFIPYTFKTKLKAIAKSERTTVSRLVMLAIESYLKQREN